MRLFVPAIACTFVAAWNPRDAAKDGSPLYLKDSEYWSLLQPQRDYDAVVFFTATGSNHGCQLCRIFEPEYKLISNSKHSNLIYSVVDFTNNPTTFQKLELSTVPAIWLFPQGKNEPIRFEFFSPDIKAEDVAKFLSRNLDKPIVVRRPINVVKVLITSLIVGGLCAIASLTYKYIQSLLQTRYLWAGLSLLLILLFNAGHMYNSIRQVPYVTGNDKGGINYIAGGFQSQLAIETHIIGLLYSLLASATLALTFKVPQMKDKWKQNSAAWLLSGTVLFLFSILLSIFRVKNGGYPFRLPPLVL